MNKKRIQIFLMVCDVALIIMVSLLLHLAKPMSTTKVVYLPQGSISQIIAYLSSKKFNITQGLDKYLIILMGKPQSGWIEIGKNHLSRGDFLHALTTSKAALQTLSLTPGESIDVFLYEISQLFSLSYDHLMYYYKKRSPLRDGWIIPETYHVPMGIGEKHLIHFLINYADKEHRALSEKIFGDYNEITWKKYLVVASIIQKEAADVEEMKLVSSVIYNRLKKGMKLQMDGTLNYGPYSHVKVTPKRIKEDTSAYNTYKFSGLPPAPVSSVQKEAIAAAIFPAKSDYLYFVKGKDGRHVFAKTYKQHLRNIRK